MEKIICLEAELEQKEEKTTPSGITPRNSGVTRKNTV